ncbi:MAG: hypothetical protein JRG74_08425 [Deltaproteobacteria bacterium]|nr:hypothetical protein [Deltaproteobacteria bacterium]MBW2664408.1 hypothetical protein [Deltaproteobacteria bacterium]
MNSNLNSELNAELCKLPIEQRFQVLEFARTLTKAKVHGVKGQALLRFAGTIEPEDLATITQTIEVGCEKVNFDEW